MSPLREVFQKDIDGVFSRFSLNSPLRRVASPKEISGICSYLASNESSFMTGAVLVIDGGASIVDVNGSAVSNAGMNWGKAK